MSLSAHTCTLTPGLCCTLLACLTGPSQNGADINRPGRSHVSVYTGRPESSTTRALDSLRTANSHTIHLCSIQKSFSVHRTCTHVHLCRNAVHPTRVMIKIPKVRSPDAESFLLLQSYLFCFNFATQPFFFQLLSFFFPCSWNCPESYVFHIFSNLTEQSARVPTNPSNLR